MSRAQVTLDSIDVDQLRAAQVAYQRTVKDWIVPPPPPGEPTGTIAVMGVAFTWRSPYMTPQHMSAWNEEFWRVLDEGTITTPLSEVQRMTLGPFDGSAEGGVVVSTPKAEAVRGSADTLIEALDSDVEDVAMAARNRLERLIALDMNGG